MGVDAKEETKHAGKKRKAPESSDVVNKRFLNDMKKETEVTAQKFCAELKAWIARWDDRIAEV